MNTAFERSTQKDEWLTPKFITDALGPFDLDPCASVVRPWDIAAKCYTVVDDGLKHHWKLDFAWMNPPYGNQTQVWFRRMVEHGNGIALTFARTETRMFFESVWPEADSILFIKGRLKFLDTAGKESGTAGAPSCLIAYGQEASFRLKTAWSADEIKGRFIEL